MKNQWFTTCIRRQRQKKNKIRFPCHTERPGMALEHTPPRKKANMTGPTAPPPQFSLKISPPFFPLIQNWTNQKTKTQGARSPENFCPGQKIMQVSIVSVGRDRGYVLNCGGPLWQDRPNWCPEKLFFPSRAKQKCGKPVRFENCWEESVWRVY